MPLAEIDNRFIDNPLCFDGFLLAILHILVNDVLKVVDIIHIGIRQPVYGRVNIPGNGDIDKKKRPVAPGAKDTFSPGHG